MAKSDALESLREAKKALKTADAADIFHAVAYALTQINGAIQQLERKSS